MRIIFMTGLAALICGLPPAFTTASAQTTKPGKPLWELGVAAGVGLLPDYPAAAQSHAQGIALPIVVYRGKYLRAGDKGLIRGRFLRTERLEFDVSLSGSFPTDSDNNTARKGMTDLDWLGEVGPRLQILLARAPRAAKLELELPVRAVFSTDLSDLSHQGYVFAPEIAYQHDGFGAQDVKLKLGLGFKFADEDLSAYFYEVAQRFATANRAVYSAKSGYMGAHLQFRALKPLGPRWRAFAALEGNFHHGSANQDSPLFRKKTTVSVGLGLIWSFWQSDARTDDE